jgi:hypothetical protein
MTFTLALDGLTDAELVDRTATGDPTAAARFWVRHWPTALTAARGLVEPAEVPGLAAEALIGTLAAIRVGSGPRSNSAVFVIDAVHELGGDEFSSQNLAALTYPDVFPSPTMARSFATLRVEDQQVLWAVLADGVPLDEVGEAVGIGADEAARTADALLGSVQSAYLRRHVELGVQPECAAAHSFLGSAVDHHETTLPTETWMHLSECVVCTEAFHELAHSTVALGPLLGAASFPGTLPDPEEPLEVPAAGPAAAAVAAAHVAPLAVLAAEPDAAAEPVPEPADAGPVVDLAATTVIAPVELDELLGPAPDVAAASEPDLAPAADDAPPTSHADPSRRRPLALVLVAAVLVGVVALAVSLLHGGSETPPASAAAGIPTGTPTGSPTETSADGRTTPGPSRTTAAAARARAKRARTGPSPTASATVDAPAAPRPTRRPTRKPSTSPSHHPTSKPPPAGTPSTPTPTPTPRCNGLQHLLHVC